MGVDAELVLRAECWVLGAAAVCVCVWGGGGAGRKKGSTGNSK